MDKVAQWLKSRSGRYGTRQINTAAEDYRSYLRFWPGRPIGDLSKRSEDKAARTEKEQIDSEALKSISGYFRPFSAEVLITTDHL